MNKKLQKFLTLLLLSSTAILLSACTPKLAIEEIFKRGTDDPTAAIDEKPSPFKDQMEKSEPERLTELLNKNQNLICNVVTDTGESNTLYTNGEYFYMETDISPGDTAEESGRIYILYKDSTLYSWMGEGDRGKRMDLSEDFTYQDNQKPLEALEKARYECETWTEVDQEMFEIPDNITLETLERPSELPAEPQQTEEDVGEETTGTDQQCRICKSIQDDEAKIACLQRNNCE